MYFHRPIQMKWNTQCHTFHVDTCWQSFLWYKYFKHNTTISKELCISNIHQSHLTIVMCPVSPVWSTNTSHGPLTSYVKLQIAHAPGMFSTPPRVTNTDMHHGKCPWLNALTLYLWLDILWEPLFGQLTVIANTISLWIAIWGMTVIRCYSIKINNQLFVKITTLCVRPWYSMTWRF